MTLMPVSKISAVGESVSKAGGSRWISQRGAALIAVSSPLSIVWPSTLKMRPSVASPTGTLIDAPVS